MHNGTLVTTMTTHVQHLSHPKYRPDIDGLRAIAVLSVVGFHAFPGWIRGGFIGVDVFFVISGFLISTIIFENLDRGTFNFAEFYARRVKRIFPALLLVLIASFAFGWFALLADEYKQLGKHVVAGVGFISNFILWREAGYFDNSAETKPLLHLWSLGIEEQFYIVWPFVLWLAWKKNVNLIMLTILVAIISFYLNLKGIEKDAVATFYSPQTRFWELLSGSTLAWFSLYKKDAFANYKRTVDGWLAKLIYRETVGSDGKTLSNVISFVGSLLLAFGFWRITKDVGFPGKWAVIPVMGAVLTILAGPKAWINRKILSDKIAVWFGLISFPLYLWHWPLLSFARIVESEVPSRNIRIAAVVLSILLAWLTYKLVERPIRLGKNSKIKVTALVVLMTFVGYAGYGAYDSNGLKFRDVVSLNIDPNSGRDGGDQGNMTEDCGVADEANRKLFRMCAKDKRGNVRFALMGDSKADALYPGLVRTSDESGRWLFIGGNGRNGAPTPLIASFPDPKRPLTNLAIEAIVSNRDIEVVVLVTAIRAIFSLSDGVKGGNLATYDYKYLSRLPLTSRSNAAFDELNRVVEVFVSAGKEVVLVVDNPALPNPKDCIARRTSSVFVNRFLGGFNDDCVVPLSEFREQTKIYLELLSKIKSNHPSSVHIFDPTEIYCDATKNICEAFKYRRLMYSYTDHISDFASGLVGERLNSFLKFR